MISELQLSHLSNQELLELKQAILAEQSRRLVIRPAEIIVELDAPPATFLDAQEQVVESP
jgi:hypothetical protein